MNEFMKENEVIGEVRAPLEHASPAEENKPDTAEKKPENRMERITHASMDAVGISATKKENRR